MTLDEAKKQFIHAWGRLGSEWGINRTMAQVHALLIISPRPLSTENIMEALSISRGNANMNLRELINWTLVSRELVPGERKEYFSAEKNVWEIAKRIARERKRRELEPVMRELEQLQDVEGDKSDPEIQAFVKQMQELNSFVGKMDRSVDTMLKAEESWFFGTLIKLMK
jgi:DNA-binding transcriptional regulator GbsR (MarR family)